MRRFFESKLVFAATLLAFVLAVMLSVAYGSDTPAPPAIVLTSQLDDPILLPPTFPTGPGGQLAPSPRA